MQLSPGETFVVVRQLDNPADTGTYYVQAVIRNSKTDEVIDTLRLDDKGSQRFTKQWQVAPDPSGSGMYIDIESRVFTDSGYTTYSDVYAKENKVLLVADRPLNVFNQGGIGDMSADIDYKRIKTMINEALAGQDNEKPDKVDIIAPILKEIGAVKAILSQIKPAEKVNLDPITKTLQSLSNQLSKIGADMAQKIEDKEVTDPTDITPVLEKLDTLDPKYVLGQVNDLVEKIRELFITDIGNVTKQVGDMHTMLAQAPFIPLPSTSIGEKPSLPPLRKRNIK